MSQDEPETRPLTPRKLNKSLLRRTLSGREKPFPTLDDMVEDLLLQGLIRDKEDLLTDRDELLSDVFFTWVNYGQLACQFAIHLSTIEQEAGWRSAVLTGALDSERLHELLEGVIAKVAGAEALQVLFPDIRTPDDIVDLINRLCESPRWYWIEPSHNTDVVGVGLRWILPSDRSVNWVLGFAPLECMPFTRRAPFAALVMRLKDRQPDNKAVLELGRVPVHLAHMPDMLNSEKERALYMAASERKRREYLNGESELTAKAKVSFSLPATLRDDLAPATKV